MLDVETDKAATEIDAPVDGVLSSINVPAGETVDVGTVIAVISVAGEDAVVTPVAARKPPLASTAAASKDCRPSHLKAGSSGKLSQRCADW